MKNEGGWGAYIPVPDAIAHWIETNGCSNETTEELPLKTPQSNKVISHKYINDKKGKKRSKDVWLYEIVGGVHSWATEDLDTADEVWKFFSKFVRP